MTSCLIIQVYICTGGSVELPAVVVEFTFDLTSLVALGQRLEGEGGHCV